MRRAVLGASQRWFGAPRLRFPCLWNVVRTSSTSPNTPIATTLEAAPAETDENYEKVAEELHQVLDNIGPLKQPKPSEAEALLKTVEPFIDDLPILTVARIASAPWPPGSLSPELHAKLRRIVFHSAGSVEGEIVCRLFIAWARGKAHRRDLKIYNRLAQQIAARINEIKSPLLISGLVRSLGVIFLRPPAEFFNLLNRRIVALDRLYPVSCAQAVRIVSTLNRLQALQQTTIIAMMDRVRGYLSEDVEHEYKKIQDKWDDREKKLEAEENRILEAVIANREQTEKSIPPTINDSKNNTTAVPSAPPLPPRPRQVPSTTQPDVRVSEGTEIVSIELDGKKISISAAELEVPPPFAGVVDRFDARLGRRRGLPPPLRQLEPSHAFRILKRRRLTPSWLLHYLETCVKHNFGEAIYLRPVFDVLLPILPRASTTTIRRLAHICVRANHLDFRVAKSLLTTPAHLSRMRHIKDVELLTRVFMRTKSIRWPDDATIEMRPLGICAARSLVGRETPASLIHTMSMLFQASQGDPLARKEMIPLLEAATNRCQQLAETGMLREEGRQTLLFFASTWRTGLPGDPRLPALEPTTQPKCAEDKRIIRCIRLLSKMRNQQQQPTEPLRPHHTKTNESSPYPRLTTETLFHAELIRLNSQRLTTFEEPSLRALRRQLQEDVNPVHCLQAYFSFLKAVRTGLNDKIVKSINRGLRLRIMMQGGQEPLGSRSPTPVPGTFPAWEKGDPDEWNQFITLCLQGSRRKLTCFQNEDLWKVLTNRSRELKLTETAGKCAKQAFLCRSNTRASS